jgi:hypothetical protein
MPGHACKKRFIQQQTEHISFQIISHAVLVAPPWSVWGYYSRMGAPVKGKEKGVEEGLAPCPMGFFHRWGTIYSVMVGIIPFI